MDSLIDDAIFLDAVATIVLGTLARIGATPRLGSRFFNRLPAVAQQVAGQAEQGQ